MTKNNTAENGRHRDTFSESDTEGIRACTSYISSSSQVLLVLTTPIEAGVIDQYLTV